MQQPPNHLFCFFPNDYSSAPFIDAGAAQEMAAAVEEKLFLEQSQKLANEPDNERKRPFYDSENFFQDENQEQKVNASNLACEHAKIIASNYVSKFPQHKQFETYIAHRALQKIGTFFTLVFFFINPLQHAKHLYPSQKAAPLITFLPSNPFLK